MLMEIASKQLLLTVKEWDEQTQCKAKCIIYRKNNDQDSLMIFLLTLLLSSYFIYNSIGIIDESAIQNLSIIVSRVLKFFNWIIIFINKDKS